LDLGFHPSSGYPAIGEGIRELDREFDKQVRRVLIGEGEQKFRRQADRRLIREGVQEFGKQAERRLIREGSRMRESVQEIHMGISTGIFIEILSN
jgi:hypothetical protein